MSIRISWCRWLMRTGTTGTPPQAASRAACIDARAGIPRSFTAQPPRATKPSMTTTTRRPRASSATARRTPAGLGRRCNGPAHCAQRWWAKINAKFRATVQQARTRPQGECATARTHPPFGSRSMPRHWTRRNTVDRPPVERNSFSEARARRVKAMWRSAGRAPPARSDSQGSKAAPWLRRRNSSITPSGQASRRQAPSVARRARSAGRCEPGARIAIVRCGMRVKRESSSLPVGRRE